MYLCFRKFFRADIYFKSEQLTKRTSFTNGVGWSHPRDDLYHSRLDGNIIFIEKKKDLFNQL